MGGYLRGGTLGKEELTYLKLMSAAALPVRYKFE